MVFNIHTAFSDDLAQAWDELLSVSASNVPFLKYNYQKLWWESRGANEWSLDSELVLITAEEGGLLRGVAPLFRTPQGELHLVGSIEISDYLDFIVRPEDAPVFVAGVLDALQPMDWQVMILDNILEGSPLIPAFQETLKNTSHELNLEPLEVAPAITLQGDWEAYLVTVKKKQRHEIRRKLRRAEESELGVTFKVIDQLEELPQAIQHVFHLMRFDEEKKDFLSPAMESLFENIAAWAFKEGILNLAFLEIDGKPSACNFSFNYDNQIWLYNSGISAEYQELSPGWVILGKLIEWCTLEGKTRFDFMRGDEEYKYRFGAENRQLYRLSITR